jgi:cytochrome c
MKFVKLLAATAVIVIGAGTTVALADGDVKKGKKVYKKCKACHTIEADGKNKVGPNLFAVVGRKSATKEGYKYSKAMMAANLEWNEENLDAYLKKPKKFIKGNKMSFAGIKKESQRKNLIAYLATFK